MRGRIAVALALVGLFAGEIGCRQRVDREPLKAAINKSFIGRHDCAWPEPIKLPATVDPSKDPRVREFDALTDAGLLIRTLVEGKRSFGVSQLIKKYDLSDDGHAAWTPEPNRPDYGNFCFGHFNVTAIDKATPNAPSNPTQYTVQYSYEVVGVPGWVRRPESMRAFPKLAADTSIETATATLVKGADGSWVVVPSGAAQ